MASGDSIRTHPSIALDPGIAPHGAPAPLAGGDPDPEEVFFPPRSAAARLRSLAALVVRAPELARWSALAVRAHGGGRLAAVRRLRFLRRRGFLFEEAVRDGMLDPAIPDRALRGYAPRHLALIAQRAVNPTTFTDLTTEKALFYRYCAAVGLPTPRLLAIVHRTTAGWGVGDRVLACAADLADVLRENPGDVVVKPSDGGKGVNVRVLHRRDGLLVDAHGSHTPEDLWDVLRADPDHACFVVQERLCNHADMSLVAPPAEALHTIRLVTFVRRTGEIEVSQAVVRLGLGGHATDNFGDGSAGNGYAEIDPATGRLGPLRRARPDGCGFVDTPDIPEAGIPIEGVPLPHWDEALALARRAAPHFLPNRSIGWDIAITDRGAVIVEANREWTPFPQPDLARTLARVARR